MSAGYKTSEFWSGVGGLAAIYEMGSMAVEKGLGTGSGIAVAGACVALAWLLGKYAQARTDAKAKEVTQ